MTAKQKKIVLIGIVFIYLVMLYNAASSLVYTLGKIRNFSGKNFQVSWVQSLNIINPSAVPVPISSANISAYVGEKKVGVAYLNGSQTARKGNTEIFFTIRIGILEIISLGESIKQQAANGALNIGYKGTISSLGINFPFSDSIKLPFKINTNV